MDRQSWTAIDDRDYQRVATAARLGWLEMIRPTRYKEPRMRVAGSHLEAARALQWPRSDDDEEPSPAPDSQRTRVLRLVVIAGAVIVGLWVLRSMMGAS